MMLKDFSLLEEFETTAQDIFTILTDERRHSSFTGAFVHITDKENEPFSLEDGKVTGKNIILERGRKIVWAFRINEPEWPEGVFSEAAIVLTDLDSNKCRVELFHTAIPENYEKMLRDFWQHHYWEPLRYYLER